MASTKIQATAKLFLDTKDAASDAKQFVADLKRQLNSIESAADKFSVFKDLVAYIAEVDQKLAELKAKNGDAFNHMFDGLDANLRNAFDSVLSQSKQIINEFDAINSKIQQASSLKAELQSAMKDVKTFKETERVDNLAKTESDALQLLNTYKELHKYINQPNVDKSSLEYYQKLIEYMKTAARLAGSYESYKDASNYSINDPSARKEFVKFGKQAEDYTYQVTSKFANGIKQSIDNIIKSLEASISNIQIKIPNIEETIATSGSGVDKQVIKNKELSSSYDDLKSKIHELTIAQNMLDQELDRGGDTSHLEKQVDDLNQYIVALDKTGAKKKEITNILGDLEFGDVNEETALRKICNLLQIEIPQAVNNAEQSINKLGSSINSAIETKDISGNVDDKMKQLGLAAEQTETKVDSLCQSIRETFIAASQLEVGVNKGSTSGKEFMSLFDGHKLISQVHGADYQVDVSTLTGQLLASLKENIVMSLHNHPDGMTFSPSDLHSFADLYYGQGTKIHGIIADGLVQTIDFTGISQDVAKKIAQSYSENLRTMSNQYAEFFSFDNGNIKLSDKVLKYRADQPDKYNQIMSAINDMVTASINDAFKTNGVESTLKGFTASDLPELAKYLNEVQQSGQNALDPIEKLKNLITTLNPDKQFNWSQYTDIFKQFSSGAIDGTQAMNQILNLESIDSQVNQAKSKLQDFLTFASQIQQSSLYGTAEDNVEIGKYIERLEVAKAELDKLGAQGLLTADQLEQVNQAFEKSKSHLVGETSHYDSFYSGGGGYAYDYYDEYRDAQFQNQELQEENANLKEQVAKQSQATSNIALYEDVNGQLALFDGLAQSAQQATDSAIELENTVKRVSTLDGQMSMFDQYSQIQKENENLQEQVKLEEQASSADKPRSTNDLDIIKQENDALREQKQLEDDINASSETGTKKTKSKITPEQKWDKKLTVDALTKYQGELRGIINNKRLGFNILDTNLNTQQQEIVDSYKGIVVQIEKTIQAVKNGEQVELSSIQATINALKEKINTYKEQNVVAEKVTKQSNKNYGASVEIRETARFNKLNEYATDPTGGYSTSTAFLDTFEKYKNAYDQLIAKRKEFANTSSLTDGDKIKFEELKKECSQYAQELEKAIKISEKIKQNSLMVSPLGEDFEDTASGRKTALTEFAQQMYNVGAASLTFKKNYNECTFAVKNSDGTFTQMTAQLDSFGRQIGVSAGETKKATNAFSSFFGDLKQKAKSLSAYLTYMVGFHAVVRQIRQGVTYVKEIDSALTELKKVTNETGAEYDAFLQKMSKTGSVIGATVSDLTLMAAEWARLGYSMEEAGQLAESTAILLNVSEFEDATTASEALISTMQAK